MARVVVAKGVAEREVAARAAGWKVEVALESGGYGGGMSGGGEGGGGKGGGIGGGEGGGGEGGGGGGE